MESGALPCAMVVDKTHRERGSAAGLSGQRFKYNAGMKPRIVVSLMLVGMLAALAVAQNHPAPEKRDPLFFARIAADVAGNVQSRSLNNFIVIYVDQGNWAAGLKDSDLGPFLKVKEAKAGRSVTVMFSEDKDAAVCVYFDGDAPFGVVAVRMPAGGNISDSDVAAAYKAVTKEMLKKGDDELSFAPLDDVATDDGAPLPGFQITSKARSKA